MLRQGQSHIFERIKLLVERIVLVDLRDGIRQAVVDKALELAVLLKQVSAGQGFRLVRGVRIVVDSRHLLECVEAIVRTCHSSLHHRRLAGSLCRIERHLVEELVQVLGHLRGISATAGTNQSIKLLTQGRGTGHHLGLSCIGLLSALDLGRFLDAGFARHDRSHGSFSDSFGPRHRGLTCQTRGLNCAGRAHAIQGAKSRLLTNAFSQGLARVDSGLHADVLGKLTRSRLQAFFQGFPADVGQALHQARNLERCSLKLGDDLAGYDTHRSLDSSSDQARSVSVVPGSAFGQ